MKAGDEVIKEALETVIGRTPSRIFDSGESWGLFREDQPCVYWIQSGLVKVGCYTQSGQEDFRYLVKGESLIGELAVFDKVSPEEFAIAVETTCVHEISVQELSKIFIKEPFLQKWIMELMRYRLGLLEKRLQSVLFKPSKVRVLDFLREYLLEFGECDEGIISIPNYLSHTDIALFTSTSRQTVNRVLNELRKSGILSYDKFGLSIPREKAQQLING
ncbi:MAG: Crp/Fnr family transcriptional regulator [Bacteroidota bacterium]